MTKIPLSKPYFDHNELKALKKVLASGWVAGQGPQGMELAQRIQRLTKTNYAIPVVNCTAALHLSLLALGIKANDEVLVSDYTFPATGHAVRYCGATPRFIDVDLATYNMRPELIAEKINKRTKAIIVVHTFGQMADMTSILKIARKYRLPVIEDAACALGASHHGKPAGSFGDLACFSFHARKNVTSGEGGMVVTNNRRYGETVKDLSCFGMKFAYHRQKHFEVPRFSDLGYNYKLSDINATIAIAQLEKYPKLLAKRKKLVAIYNRLLQGHELIAIPQQSEHNCHIFQSYVVTLNPKINRDKLIRDLLPQGIQTQIGTYASHIQPVYASADKCPNSLYLFRHSLALPLYYELAEKQVPYIIAKLNACLRKQF